MLCLRSKTYHCSSHKAWLLLVAVGAMLRWSRRTLGRIRWWTLWHEVLASHSVSNRCNALQFGAVVAPNTFGLESIRKSRPCSIFCRSIQFCSFFGGSVERERESWPRDHRGVPKTKVPTKDFQLISRLTHESRASIVSAMRTIWKCSLGKYTIIYIVFYVPRSSHEVNERSSWCTMMAGNPC